MEVRQNPLGSAPLGKLLVKFAVPSIISMLVSALYNIVDQIFIGQGVGMYGNAATNVAFPLTTLATAVGLMLGIGEHLILILKWDESMRRMRKKSQEPRLEVW